SGREAQEGESVARLVTAARSCRDLHIGASAHCGQHLSFVRRVLEPGRAALREHGERTPANRNDRLGAFLHVVACLELRLKRTALTRLLTDEEENVAVIERCRLLLLGYAHRVAGFAGVGLIAVSAPVAMLPHNSGLRKGWTSGCNRAEDY